MTRRSPRALATRTVDRSSPVPFYYQLQEILKEEIEHGVWRPNELLPSEAQLERRFRVSRTVIRQALDVLQADGQITRVKGKGSIVSEPKFRWEATTSARNWQQSDLPVEVRVGHLIDQRQVPAGGLIGRLLEVSQSATVIELTFTQLVDNRPVALSQMYLRPQASPVVAALVAHGAYPAILRDGGDDPLRQLARQYEVRPGSSDVMVEMSRANDFEAETLEVQTDSPVFLLTALELEPDGTPIAFTRTVLRADRARLSMVLHREEPVGVDGYQSLAPFVSPPAQGQTRKQIPQKNARRRLDAATP
jgi:GntR family transcriptional regulator